MAIVLGAWALFGAEISVTHALASGPVATTGPACCSCPAVSCSWAWAASFSGARASRPASKWLRRVLIGVGAVVVAFELVLPVGLALIATHRPRVPVETVAFARPAREVTLTTNDGLVLAATYVPAQNGAAVIVFPREWTARQGQMLADHGFGVLLLDPRGYGASEGDPNAFGWGSRQDVDAAVDYVRGRPDVTAGRIGGLGLSVGGEQMIEAAAHNVGLLAVVSDGAGERSVRDAPLRSRRLPSLPNAAVQTAAVAVLSGDAPPPSLATLAGQIAPRPLMLVYAGQGGGGEELQPEYFAAAGRPKTLLADP